jgi:hypothetical protein
VTFPVRFPVNLQVMLPVRFPVTILRSYPVKCQVTPQVRLLVVSFSATFRVRPLLTRIEFAAFYFAMYSVDLIGYSRRTGN